MAVLTWLVSLFTGPLGSIATQGIKWGAIALVAWGALTAYKNSVVAAAVAEQNRKQLEQVIKDQADYARKLEDVVRLGNALSADLKRQSDQIDERFKRVDDWLSEPGVADRPASDLLKQLVEKLKRGEKPQ